MYYHHLRHFHIEALTTLAAKRGLKAPEKQRFGSAGIFVIASCSTLPRPSSSNLLRWPLILLRSSWRRSPWPRLSMPFIWRYAVLTLPRLRGLEGGYPHFGKGGIFPRTALSWSSPPEMSWYKLNTRSTALPSNCTKSTLGDPVCGQGHSDTGTCFHMFLSGPRMAHVLGTCLWSN